MLGYQYVESTNALILGKQVESIKVGKSDDNNMKRFSS